MKYICVIVWFTLATSVSAGEAKLPTKEAAFSLSYDELTLRSFNDEKMGILGGNLLFEIEGFEGLFIGPAAYGSITGQRGGFITLGLASKLNIEINKALFIEGGTFVGAGGGHGGYQLQGGGLMLREHIGLGWHGDLGALTLGVSRVDYPNGHVASTQGYVSYAKDFLSVLPSGWLTKHDKEPLLQEQRNRNAIAVTYKQYNISSSVVNSAGGAQFPTLGLVGITWKQSIADGLYVRIETEGAMRGQSNGYMQILLGLGAQYPVANGLSIYGSASAGVAGGGGVDTGGGLLTDMSVGVQAQHMSGLFLAVDAGLVSSPQASFKARSVAVHVGQSFDTPQASGREMNVNVFSGFDVQHLRMRFVHQSYFELSNSTKVWRTHHANRDVNLLGFQNDFFLNEYAFITGQGIAAYEGQAGGYMTGLLGAGFKYPVHAKWSVETEALIGAAGGGGLTVGGGLVWQVNAGAVYQLTDSYDIIAQIGRINAPKGDFAANTFSISTAYSFSLFMH